MGLRWVGLCLALAGAACCAASARTADELWDDAARFEAEQSLDLALRSYRRLLHDFPDDPRSPEAGLGELRLELATDRRNTNDAVIEGVWRRYCERYRDTEYEARACAAVAVSGTSDDRLRQEVIQRLVTVLHALPRPASAAAREARAQLCLTAGKAAGDWLRDPWADASWCLRSADNLAVEPDTKASARRALAVQLRQHWPERGNQTPVEAAETSRRWAQSWDLERRVVADFPRTQAAGAALLRLAQHALEHDPAEAARLFQQVLAGWPGTEAASTAQYCLETLTEPSFDMDYEHESWHVLPPQGRYRFLASASRLDNLLGRLHPFDLDDLFNADEGADYDALLLHAATGKPVLRWTMPVPPEAADDGVEFSSPPLPRGTYVAVLGAVGVEEEYRLLQVTDLSLLCQRVGDQLWIQAASRVGGEPLAQVELAARWWHDRWRHDSALGHEVTRAVTAADGHAVIPLPDPARLDGFVVLARHGDDTAVAMSEHFYAAHWPPREQLVGDVVFDRPAYRPGDRVRFSALLGRFGTQFKMIPNTPIDVIARVETEDLPPYDAEILDSKELNPPGVLYQATLSTNRFSSVAGDFVLPEDVRPGNCSVSLQAGEESATTWFTIAEYRKELAKAWVETPQGEIEPGQQAVFRIRAQTLFGAWLDSAQVRYDLSAVGSWAADPLTGPSEHDPRGPYRRLARSQVAMAANGTIEVPFETLNDGADYTYRLTGTVTDASRRRYRVEANWTLHTPGLYLFAAADRRVFHDGDPARLTFAATDGAGRPVALPLTVGIRRLTWRRGKHCEEFEPDQPVLGFLRGELAGPESTVRVPDSGQARFEQALPPGWYEAMAEADDPFQPGQRRRATVSFRVEGPDADAACGFEYPMLLTDRDRYQPGETVRLSIVSPTPGMLLLNTSLTPDQAPRTVRFAAGSTVVDVPLPEQCPMVVDLGGLISTAPHGGLLTRRIEVAADRPKIGVTVESDRDSYDIADHGRLRLQTVDADGRPVSAQVSVAVADEAAMNVNRPAQRPFAYLERREPHLPSMVSSDEADEPGEEGLAWLQQHVATGMMVLDDFAPLWEEMMAERPSAWRDAGAWRALARSYVARIESLSNGGPASLVRSDFPDTMFWEPAIVTGEDGRAEVPLTFPDSLTTWRATATAITADGRTGVGQHNFMTTKDLVVSLLAPRALTQFDHATISALVSNRTGHDETVTVEVALAGAALVEPDTRTVTVPASRSLRVDREITVPQEGQADITLTATGSRHADAVRHQLTVDPHNAAATVAAAGLATPDSPSAATLALPADSRPGSVSLRFEAAPNLVAGLLDALPYFDADEEAMSTEQHLSQLLSALRIAQTIGYLSAEPAPAPDEAAPAPDDGDNLGEESPPPDDDGGEVAGPPPGMPGIFTAALPDAPAAWRARHLVDLKRLLDDVSRWLEPNVDGGVSWYPGLPSDPRMTVWAVSASLALRRVAGGQADYSTMYHLPDLGHDSHRGEEAPIDLNAEKLKADPYESPGSDEPTLMAYLYRRLPLLQHDPELQMEILAVLQQAVVDELPEPVTDAAARRDAAVEQLYAARGELTDSGRVRLAVVLHQRDDDERALVVWRNHVGRRVETGETVHWGEPRGGDAWTDSAVTATALTLRALHELEPRSPLAEKAARWLQLNRVGTHWRTGKETTEAVLALAEHAARQGPMGMAGGLTVMVNGRAAGELTLAPDDAMLPISPLSLDANLLRAGSNTIEVRTDGGARAWWAATLRYTSTEDPLRAAGHEVSIARQLWQIKPGPDGEQRIALPAGEPVLSGDIVEVELTIRSENELACVEVVSPKPAGCEPAGGGWGWWYGREDRDRETRFRLDWLGPGDTIVRYRLRAESPGTFRMLPAEVRAAYRPDAHAISDEATLKVYDRY